MSGNPGDQTNRWLAISSQDHTRKPLNLIKKTTTQSWLVQPGMKRIVSRNKKSSPHAKGPNGILTTKESQSAPPNDQKIRVNLIFAVKYNRRHKARLFTDGALTLKLLESIHSAFMSMRHFRLVIFLGELNSLDLCGADIGMPIWRPTPMKGYGS